MGATQDRSTKQGLVMHTNAVLLIGPKQLSLEPVGLCAPKPSDVVIRIEHSAISSGTEKLFWTGKMPPFPGMGYPLVPGYEAAGEVVETGSETNLKVGDRVFVPGANCFEGAFGLFGGSSRYLVSSGERVIKIDPAMGAQGSLFALAATARHVLAGLDAPLPELIVGHGVLGRLLARLTLAAGAPPPTVWELQEERMHGAEGYEVLHPDQDTRKDYGVIIDASGQSDILDQLFARLQKGGIVTLAGFYAERVNFAFPMAFMKEAQIKIAAEWTTQDMDATRALVESGALSLDHLITHHASACDAAQAYATAFEDPACLKMALDWKEVA